MRGDRYKMIVLQIGAGGTGGYITEELVKVLASTNQEHVLTVIDGDIVEERNLERQAFYKRDINKNKAEALISRVDSLDSENVHVFGLTDYIKTWVEIVNIVTKLWELYENQDEVMIVCGADNNVVRHRIDLATKTLHELKVFENVLIVDSGNTEYTGECLVTVLEKDKEYADNVLDYRLARLSGDLDSRLTYGDFELSCEVVSESQPQNIGTNMLAGYAVLTSIIKWLTLQEAESLSFNARTGYVTTYDIIDQTEYVEMLENSSLKATEYQEYQNTKQDKIEFIQ